MPEGFEAPSPSMLEGHLVGGQCQAPPRRPLESGAFICLTDRRSGNPVYVQADGILLMRLLPSLGTGILLNHSMDEIEVTESPVRVLEMIREVA